MPGRSGAPQPGSNPAGVCSLWPIAAAAAVVYFVLRSSTDFVWDDTIQLYFLPRNAVHGLPSFADALRNLSGASNYRPLATYVAIHATAFAEGGAVHVYSWLVLIAAAVGCCTAVVFKVARRLLASSSWGLVATLLFCCSPAFLTGSWVVLAGQQPLVSLLMCLGVLLYLEQEETRGLMRALAVTGLSTILLLGPWYREFLGVVAGFVVLEEVRRYRRPTWIMGLGVAGTVHALFPMLLPKLFLDPSLPLIPTPFLGDVGTQLGTRLSGGGTARLLDTLGRLRYGVATYLLALFPPTIVILSLLGFVLKSVRGLTVAERTETTRNDRFRRWTRLARNFRQDRTLAASGWLVVLAVIATALAELWPDPPTRAFAQTAIVDVVIGTAFALYGWSVSPLLGTWMVLTLLPLYWVFTEIVHLAYPMVPAAIIAAAGLRECWLAVRRLNTSLARPLQYALAGAITFLLLDQALNLYSAWRVVQACNRGMRDVAATLRRDIPRGSVVIGNVIHLYDIDRDAAGWFQPYFTVRAGTPGPYADSPAEVASLVSRHPATTYLLDADQPYLPDQYLYHSHPLVRTHAVNWIDLGVVHKTEAVYPFLDPLQGLTPRTFVPFLGAPDLVQDFYRGRALSGAPFLREVYVRYHLYRVTGTTVRPW
ncbi:MAG TPA: hypothetical protein VJT33_11805 [bacterium]|nr:hypothetical protein [bacterium]